MAQFENIPPRFAKALIVQEYGREDVDAVDYLQHCSDRDPEVLDG